MSDSVWPYRWQATRLPHPWDSPGKNTGVGCYFLLQCMTVKTESEVTRSWVTPWTAAHQAPPPMGFSRQEYWSGVPLPSLLPLLGPYHSVLYRAHLCMKCSFGISNFLEELSSLSHSVVFLCFFALIAEEDFLISPCYSLELCIQILYLSFSPLLFTYLLYTAICKPSPDKHFSF